ncbi:uracil phosphoribosyltransferase [Cytophagaceae bacterium ABcell3]|nr:uracil phosphoribosyltransferase [Cytophagaceae bacterium ABcell3]
MVILSESNSIANSFLAEMRSVNTQKDPLRFRRNMERLGEILAYEISKTLSYKVNYITTPLGIAQASEPEAQPVLATVLRAGIPFHQGFLNYFDRAENAFVGSFRNKTDEETFDIKTEYLSSPSLADKVLILTDPMLATGKSMQEAVLHLKKYGEPSSIHIASIIASQEGVAHIQETLPDAHVWAVAVDDTLNAKKYIMPGLGDAGDLAYGSKL